MAEAGWITTEGVACRLEGIDVLGQPSGKAMNRAGVALTKMQKAGYVRRVRPWTRGRLWGVGGAGAEVIAELSAPRKAKRFRTFPDHRKKSKARRDVARGNRRCVNENSRGTHGPATHGCRCRSCHETHKRTA